MGEHNFIIRWVDKIKNINCIFVAVEDCPKDEIRISCVECIENKYYGVINQAVDDFTSLGESFTDMFLFCNKLMKHSGETSELEIVLDSTQKINRVMTAFLSQKENEEMAKADVVYRRLIFYLFSILIDEFEIKEYTKSRYVN